MVNKDEMTQLPGSSSSGINLVTCLVIVECLNSKPYKLGSVGGVTKESSQHSSMWCQVGGDGFLCDRQIA